MKRLSIVLIALCFLSMPVLAFSGELSETFMLPKESSVVRYVDKKSGDLRSEVSSVVTREERDGKTIYVGKMKGKGSFDEFENCTWTVEGKMEERDGFLWPIYTLRTYYDADGKQIASFRKDFDYKKKRVYIVSTDENGKERKKALPIKGKTIDNFTMIYFLKTYMAHRGDKKYKQYYYVSDEPKLYNMKLLDSGTEEFELPSGEKVQALKTNIYIDMGLLTGLTKMMIPPTFVWYTPDSPYVWLQYEGLETSLGSPHIIATIVERDPPIK